MRKNTAECHQSHTNESHTSSATVPSSSSAAKLPLPPTVHLPDAVDDKKPPNFSLDSFVDKLVSLMDNDQSSTSDHDSLLYTITPPYTESYLLPLPYPANNIGHCLPLTTSPPLHADEPPSLHVNYPTNNLGQYLEFPTVPQPYAEPQSFNKPSTVNSRDDHVLQGSLSVPNGWKLDNRVGDLSCMPPGYKFCPNDEELILSYLMKKVSNRCLPCNVIIDVDLYKFNPWDLAEKFNQIRGEKKWYFTPIKRKYPNGERPSRAAGDGYWKATGADQKIIFKHRKPYNDEVYGHIAYGDIIGTKKALVFYVGLPPGDKTHWIMHEYNLFNKFHRPNKKDSVQDMQLDPWVLCSIYHKGCGKSLQRSSQSDDENELIMNNESTSIEYMQDHQLPNH
ncbi:hypothetical protein Ddye_014648 [Dipteronia dyeriana]|uniref:NAC domain-containing protein n=1 Tax=Dipteronia dyeriana TaxID=168575 RepID=A0AAE0CKS2_9ROSI|nr:hypothetical protein Ddye_014648 [Dipteronia dyeriana]